MLPRNFFFPRPGPGLRGIFANARPSLRPQSIMRRAENLERIDAPSIPQTRDDYVVHNASWLKVLKDDKRAIFTAASHAQKAADFLHGLQPQGDMEAEERQEEEALA
jgi:antirestriction protein ArdC